MKKILIFIFVILFSCAFAAYADVIRYNPEKIKVYIPPKNSLSLTMKHAFMDWQRHTNNKIVFEYVGTKSTANIEVIFVANTKHEISAICRGESTLGCNKKIIAKTSRGNQKCVDSKLYISMRDNNGKIMTPNEIYTIMLHEVGHALGLVHSSDINSLMYPATNKSLADRQEIRQEDVDTVLRLYGLK